MTTKDVSTKFRLEFEGKGAEQLQKKISGIAESLAPEKLSGGFQKMEHFMKQNERQLRGMEQHFKTLNKSLHAFGSTVDKINDMASGLQKVKKEAKEAGEEAQKAGAFLQGLFQGAGIGEYLPRGPGMGRQVAGRLTGNALRGGVGGMAGMATGGGVGALAQGLSSIPGGGIIGGMVQGAMGHVQAYRQFEQTRLGLAPFMDLGALGARNDAAASARARVMAEPLTGIPTLQGVMDKMRSDQAARRSGARRSGFASDPMDRRLQIGANAPISVDAGEAARAVNNATQRAMEAREARAEEAAAAARAASTARTGMEGLAGVGSRLGGINLQQTTQFAQGVLGASGGTLGEMRFGKGGDLIATALAAQTAYGIEGSTVGAFGRGARRGGLAGASGTGANDFERLMSKAVAAGMDGSEVRQFMQETAAGIQQFRQTGIPMAPETMLDLGQSMSLSLGIDRGQFVGQTLGRRAQQIGMGGVKSAGDFLMLQTLGGFKGGGLTGLEEAEQQLVSGNFGSEQLQKLVRQISEGSGGGVAGRYAMRRVLQGMGAQISPEEAKQLQQQAMTGEGGGPLFERTLKDMQMGRDRAKLGLQGTAEAAVSGLAPTARARAALDNQQLEIGGRLTTTMDNLERATAEAHKSVGKLAKPLEDITGSAQELSRLLPKAATWLSQFFGSNQSVSDETR